MKKIYIKTSQTELAVEKETKKMVNYMLSGKVLITYLIVTQIKRYHYIR